MSALRVSDTVSIEILRGLKFFTAIIVTCDLLADWDQFLNRSVVIVCLTISFLAYTFHISASKVNYNNSIYGNFLPTPVDPALGNFRALGLFVMDS